MSDIDGSDNFDEVDDSDVQGIISDSTDIVDVVPWPEGFDYGIMKRTSWLVRRVEAWSYTGDALWKRSISFDIDMEQLLRLKKSCNFDSKFFLLPLFEFDKNKQLVDFDARDRYSNPMHLVLREHSAMYTLSALRGAIATEHGDGSECVLDELSDTDMLSEVLGALFQEAELPEDEYGIIRREDEDCFERIVSRVKAQFSDLIPKYGAENAERAMRQLNSYIDSSPVFRHFLITYSYKWLPCLRVEFGTNSLGEDTNTLVKICLCETKDIISEAIPVKSITDRVSAQINGLRFQHPLDFIGTAEKEHITIKAPDGTYFSPCYRIEKSTGKEIRDDKGPFYISDEMVADVYVRPIISTFHDIESQSSARFINKSASKNLHLISETGKIAYSGSISYSNLEPGKSYKLSGVLINKRTEEPFIVNGEEIRSESSIVFAPGKSAGEKDDVKLVFDIAIEDISDSIPYQSLSNPQIKASGTLTPGYATLKTAMRWWGERKERLFRRLPVEGSEEHNYSLNLLLCPKLGLRAVGYNTFLALSALVFLVCCLCPGVYLPQEGATETDFSLGSLLMLAPLMMMIVVNRDEEPFIRKRSFRFPSLLTKVCIGVDSACFVFFMLIGLNTITIPLSLASCIALFSSILCAVLLVLCLYWTIRHAYNKWRWTNNPDAFCTFPIVIAPIDPKVYKS